MHFTKDATTGCSSSALKNCDMFIFLKINKICLKLAKCKVLIKLCAQKAPGRGLASATLGKNGLSVRRKRMSAI